MENLPAGLSIEGLNRSIINIDKPAGATSSQVTDFVKKQLGLNKASHFGTLDPAVGGVLPIALGRAAKLTGYFSKQDKEYVGVMHLHGDTEKGKIEEAIKKKFLGKIKQLPPVKSHVKRELREREIKKFDILEKEGKGVLFRVECEAGTYIRKLVHDLGEGLGVGAHMAELRRIRASVFLEKNAITLYELQKAAEEYRKGKPEKLGNMLMPIEIITRIMPSIIVKQEALEKLKHGSPLFADMLKQPSKFKKGDFIALLFNNVLVEIAQAELDSKDIKQEKAEGEGGKRQGEKIIAKPRTVFN